MHTNAFGLKRSGPKFKKTQTESKNRRGTVTLNIPTQGTLSRNQIFQHTYAIPNRSMHAQSHIHTGP